MSAHRTATVLGPVERKLAEELFDALLGPVEEHGLPAFASLDKEAFYQAIQTAPGPAFMPGLRGMLYALSAAVAAQARLARPLGPIDREARFAAVEALSKGRSYVLRQALSTMKILACFAYFEAPSVRATGRRALGPEHEHARAAGQVAR